MLSAAADISGSALSIDWKVQPLEGFESSSIAENAANYDLVVLDHPHLGDAVEGGHLLPLDEYFPHVFEAVGPSLESYRYEGKLWALPLDAATQVSASKNLSEIPTTWDDVVALSHSARVALNLAGPHAFLTFCSIAVAIGEEPSRSAPFISPETGIRVLNLMTDISSRAPVGTESLNPIALLELIQNTDELAYCPLIYGYVNYSSAVAFGDAPVVKEGGRHGSVIGGTGIAISARCEVTPELLDHIRWLMSASAQQRYIPQHEGQPSARDAWTNEAVNRDSHDFYRNTLATIDDAWVRPRFAGFVPVQSAASAIIREAVINRTATAATLEALNQLFPEKAAA
ncbi:extracellular solute-binding protein [Lacisediminihabitans profunda]|uniref:extracellular solute-binding protein n=1 Tax=Lacisediminihabitans profunda TaxID=2594790 RepID=UPI001C9C60E1|nr:extracellular solute-binding protein [Lacisediminihabitans profunda]